MRSKQAFTSILVALLLVACTSGGTRAATTKYDLKKMTLVYAVLGKVRTRYVNPKRINPKKMLSRALDNIQRKIPEVIVREKNSSSVEIQVDNNRKTFGISDVGSPWDLTKKLEAIFSFIQKNLRPETKQKGVEYAAIEGILDTLDPHSNLMRPSFFRQLQIDTSGSFGGLGIEISICDGTLTIRRPLKHTPAWNTRMKYGKQNVRIEPPGQEAILKKTKKSWDLSPIDSGHRSLRVRKNEEVIRLRAGDKIVRIEKESTVNMTLEQAVSRLRGKPDSDVVIWIKREGWKKPKPFGIRRARIRIPSVSHKNLGDNIGYLKIKKFQSTTRSELQTAFRQLKSSKKSKLKGLVLDLRNNHGGLLDQAVHVADAFTPSGTIVSTMGFGGGKRRDLRARKQTTLAPDVPMVILVNGESASASEIVAAALKQLNRAVVIGDNTFGKGSVQVIFKTPGKTGLKLTVSQWFAPGNFSIQQVGLTPDIRMVPVQIRKNKPPIYFTAKRRSRGERDYKAALKQGVGSTSLKTKPYATIHYLKKPTPSHAKGFHCRFCGQTEDYEPPPNPDIFVKDGQLEFAKRFLSSSGTSRRLKSLANAGSFFALERKKQETEIVEKFKTMGIDWSAGKKTPDIANLKANIFIGKKGRIKAGQKLKIRVQVTNTGNGPAHRVRAETFSTNNRLKNLEFFLGHIPPGKSKVADAEIRFPKGYPAQTDLVKFKFFEQFNRGIDPVERKVEVLPLKSPKFGYSYKLTEGKKSDKDGLFEKEESLVLTLTLKNTGAGPTQEAYAELSNLSGGALFVQKGRFKIKRLRPGQSKTYRFTFDLREIPKEDGVSQIRLKVQDCVMGTNIGERIVFKIWPKGKKPKNSSGVARPKAPILEGGRDVFLRLCPHRRCSPLAKATKNDLYKIKMKINGWLMTEIEGRKAFMKSTDVVRIKPKSDRARARFVPLWNVVPPEVKIASVKQVVDTDSIQIKAQASHSQGIADVFVRVSNIEKDIFSKKAFYKSSDTEKTTQTLDFSADIPLWEGKNLVEIVARVNERVTKSKIIVILKTPVDLEKTKDSQ